MNKLRTSMIAIAMIALSSTDANAQYKMDDDKKGTAQLCDETRYPGNSIVGEAMDTMDHTTLVAAVNAAGLVETLRSIGPFTMLAFTNDAFAALPESVVDHLLMPEAQGLLATVLTYHVLSGSYDMNALKAAIEHAGGKATMKSVEGGELTFMNNDDNIMQVMDTKGGVANISTYDIARCNGFIHVIDRVLMP